MQDEFVRRDVFDAETKRLQSEIDSLHTRIDDLRDSMDKTTSTLGIAVALFAVLMAGLQVAIAFAPLIMSGVK